MWHLSCTTSGGYLSTSFLPGTLMRINRATLRHAAAFSLLVGLILGPWTSIEAQLSTTGRLAGTLIDAGGQPVPQAQLTLSRDGVILQIAAGAINGSFAISGLTPGMYSLLAEQVGYQPVRVISIPITAGQTTTLHFRIERRPPPIESVEVRRYQGVGASALGTSIEGTALDRLDRHRDATDLGRNFSEVVSAFNTPGFAMAANGLGPTASQLVVDGLEESLIRNPALPAEPATAPIFGRDGVAEVRLAPVALDGGVPGAAGASLAMVSRFAAGRRIFSPWLDYSGSSLGGAELDNPADSSAASLRGGIALGGPIKGDTASWFLRLDFQNLEQPTAAPLGADNDNLAEGITAAANGSDVAAVVNPVVRTWKGATAQAGGSYRIGDSWRLIGRLGAASWNEDAPLVISSPAGNADGRVESRDFSLAVGVDHVGEEVSTNSRVGIRTSSRDWTTGDLPFTSLGAEGVAFGPPATMAGKFDESYVQAVHQFIFPLGRHEVRAGGMVGRRSFTYDWLTGGSGSTEFGSLSDFAAGRGSWLDASASSPAEKVSLLEYAIFADGILRVSDEFELQAGVRYQVERIPDDFSTPSIDFARVFGLINGVLPRDHGSSIGPRGGLTWRPGGSGTTLLKVVGGLYPGHWDRAALAEVSRYSGGVSVRRSLGDIDWPATPAAFTTARPYALFGEGTRTPRSSAIDGLIRQALPGGTTLSLSGGYRHTDYLLRRADMNRPAAPLATLSDGRAVWGELSQVGSLIAPVPSSNSRFQEFDRVYGLTSSGYAEEYHATVGLKRAVGAGFTIDASYTWSKSEDNLVGARSADPADRLSPLLNLGSSTDWDVGRSDYDIPSRLTAGVAWQAPNDLFSFAARFRMRSGLPFTAGYPLGTDVNGDGSSANDPVALDAVAGLESALGAFNCESAGNKFAVRNGCRGEAVRALDLQASVRLPIASRQVRLTVAAFNLATTETGFVDHAAVLVDPDGAIGFDAKGREVLPLMLNPNFGSIRVRRNDPRTIRIGLRVEN